MSELETWSVVGLSSFVRRVGEALELPDIDADIPLANYGFDSLDMLVVVMEVESAAGGG